MEGLDLKQMSAMVDIIAEEKGLPKDTVLNVIEQAIAAAWRRDNGDKDMTVRAALNTNTGEADVYIVRTIVNDEDAYNPNTEVPLAEVKKDKKYILVETPEEATDEVAKGEGAEGDESENGGAENSEEAKDGESKDESSEETKGEEEEKKETEKPTEKKKHPAIGDIVEEKAKVTGSSIVAAQTAKQVMIQRLRDAENEAVLSEYEGKIGTIVTGLVSRVEPKIVRIDLGRANGIMPRSEQIDGEYYAVGSRIKVYIKNIERTDKGAQLVLSRGSADFIECLFRQEVPEIDNGTVEIKGIAREAGRRTKIAVTSTAPGVDPVGTFVGGRGVRVQAVMNEIGDREKIDIVTWSENPSEYIREALSPAEINKVEIEGKKAKVYVTEDMQSIAIGKQGQNVRLASKLTGYDIDIELVKAAKKKKSKNVEDSLLSALEETSEEEKEVAEDVAEVATEEAANEIE